VPAQDGIGRDESGHVLQPAATEPMPEHGQAPTLVISESKRAVTQLGAERAVLLEQVGEGLGFAFSEPGTRRDREPAEGDDIDHGARIAET